MKKIKLLFTLLLSVVGIAQLHAETADFENSLPEGWEIVGNMIYYERPKTGEYSIGNSSNSGWETNRGNYIATTKLQGTLTFWIRSYKQNTTGYVSLYKLSDDGEVGEQLTYFSTSSTTFAEKSFTLDEPTRLAIVINYAHLDNMTYEPYETIEGPALVVMKNGKKLESGCEYDFGLTIPGTLTAFTLYNPGTRAVPVDIKTTGGFIPGTNSVILLPGDKLDLGVMMPAETTTGKLIFIPNPLSGLPSFVINLKGTIRDINKMFVNFADGLPDEWTNNNWTISQTGAGEGTSGAGYAIQQTSVYAKYRLTSPLVTVAEGEPLLFMAAAAPYYGSVSQYTGVDIDYSTDGVTWTTARSIIADELTTSYQAFSVEGIPAGKCYISFNGAYTYITDIYGFELPQVAKMVVEGSDHNFGMITENATATFTIKNTGRAELEGISVASSNAKISVSGAPKTLGIGEEAEVTVTMSAATKGLQTGVITIKATGQETVTLNMKGYVVDQDAIYVTFDDNSLPAGWENTGWNIDHGEATGSYTSSTSSKNSEMVTAAVTVAAGEAMAIEAKGNSSYAEFVVYYSADNGATWTEAKNFNTEMSSSTSDYTVVVVDNIPAGDYKLKFEGYAVSINAINGYHLNANAPEMAVSYNDAAVENGYTDNFGKLKAAATHTYTVKNAGTGTLKVNISSSDTKAFTVAPANVTLAAGESATFGITLVFDTNYGDKTANITLHPTTGSSADVVITANAVTADPNVWEEDFQGSNSIPAGWVNNGWTISRKWNEEAGVNHAYSGSSNDNTLITPRLTAKAGDVLEFDVIDAEDGYPLKVEWSHDGVTWTEAGNVTETCTYQFVAPENGNYYIRLSGRYIYVDNFYGFKLDLPEHYAVIEKENIPATGNQFAQYTASVTVGEIVGKEEPATAKLYVDGKEVASTETTLAASSSTTISLSYTPQVAASNVDAYIVVTYAGGTLTTNTQKVTINPAFTLDESVASTFATGTYNVALLNYTVRKWNTICLPFNITDLSIFGEGVKLFQLQSFDGTEMRFENASQLYYGVPYVMYVASPTTESEFRFDNLNIRATEPDAAVVRGDVSMQGTFEPMNMAGKYGVVPATGEIKKGGQYSSLDGFRAYFELAEGVNVDGITLCFDDNGDIDRISAAEIAEGMDDTLYDLGGRKVNNGNLKPGVYVRNGKKIVVK